MQPIIDKEICKKASQLQKALVPTSRIQFANDNTTPLLEELLHDRLDAAIVSLPITDERLRVEVIKRERLVVCLPSDHPLAKKGALSASDLSQNLTVFHRPAQHPEAHVRKLELLAELGVLFEEHSHTSHPQEMQEVVKNGEGFALIREGTVLIEGISTRPIIGVNWTVNTAVVFKRNPKSRLVPVLAKHLKREFLHATAIQN
jgi:DNA-binding transcriptional LysR family regulator